MRIAERRPISPSQLALVRVREVMNTRPRKVRPETPIDEMIERLLSQIEGCFPVVDENEKLVGIVTESDVLHILQVPSKRSVVGPATVRDLKKKLATRVEEIMTRDPVTVSPDMSIDEVLNIMAAHKLRHLPVTEKGKLVGLICLRNIVEFYRLLR